MLLYFLILGDTIVTTKDKVHPFLIKHSITDVEDLTDGCNNIIMSMSAANPIDKYCLRHVDPPKVIISCFYANFLELSIPVIVLLMWSYRILRTTE